MNNEHLIASGEAGFADQDTQVPNFYAGMNQNYPSPLDQESGVIYTYPENSGTQNVYGIKDSFLSPPREISSSGIFEGASLGVFYPYVHYYPRMESSPSSLFSTKKYPVPVTIDYSLTFAPNNSYNRYREGQVDYDAVDESGNPIFEDEAGKPPTRFG